jgi:adenine-specific DNA-methyltransferase
MPFQVHPPKTKAIPPPKRCISSAASLATLPPAPYAGRFMAGKYDHLSKEALIAQLEDRDERQPLGLVWERDPSKIGRDQNVTDQFVTLHPQPEHSCGSGPQQNLILEGDNYDALRLLRMTHAGRVKCIYIDPPYNTGNRDFIYNDRFINPEDGWRHSKWIEFMHQRLTLARHLLREDGVIFVSIDDNELFHLGMLMNQIFGEGNFVANVIWQKVFCPKKYCETLFRRSRIHSRLCAEWKFLEA